MRPFFTYFGAKWRLAKTLGPPRHDLVIEPFAGSAAYSTYYEPQKVILIDVSPIICGVWSYLIKVSAKEIMKLPANIMGVDDLPSWVPQEAKWLVGFWMNHGLAEPGRSRSNWARQPKYTAFYWSETIKTRIASQLPKIRHWQVIQGNYDNVENHIATWHIDPPYSDAGTSYRHHTIDYRKLATWCRSRKGWIQVCEDSAADWLPFIPYTVLRTHRSQGFTSEAVWTNEP
jgi:hypothetical protein